MTNIMNMFKTIYKYWMTFARKLAIIPTTIILFIIYFPCVGAISLINIILRKDLLDKKITDRPTFWHDKELIPADMERCKKQF